MSEVTYLCPAHERHRCAWEGDMNDIYEHFSNEHDELLRHTNEVEIDLSVKSENILMLHDEEIFLVQQRIEDDILYIKLRFLGLGVIANNITYHLYIVKNPLSDHYPEFETISRDGGWEIGLKSVKDRDINTITCCFEVDKSNLEENFSIQSEASSKSDTSKSDPQDVSDYEGLEALKKIITVQKYNSYTEGSRKRPRGHLTRSSRYKSVIVAKTKDNDINRTSSFDDSSRSRLSTSFTNDLNVEKIVDIINNTTETDNNVTYKEEDLPCATCKKIMLPPIFFCENQHSICTHCTENPCGVCQKNVTDKRNKNLEDVSRNVLHACKYTSEGCDKKFQYNEIRNHEIKCKYCLYSCPLENCPVEGTLIEFRDHLGVFHGNIKISSDLVNDCPKGSNFFVVNQAKGIFYCTCRVINNFLEWQVLFCGPPERQFFCELYFKNSKNKDKLYLKRNKEKYVISKEVDMLKKMKVKDKYAVLEISSYD